MNMRKAVYYLASALTALLFIRGQAFGIPYSIIPNGSIKMQYSRNWSNRWENANESIGQGYTLGAVGFVLNERIMKYRIDTTTSVTDSDYAGMPYTLELRIRLLELGMNAPWTIARFPHPVSLYYSRYASYDNAVNSYGLNIQWNLPQYIHFFKDGKFVTLSRTRGGIVTAPAGADAGRDSEWGVIESGYGDQIGKVDVEDEGWGEDEKALEDEWPEEAGAVGWGNGPGIWDPKTVVKDSGKIRAPSGRKTAVKPSDAPPLFTIPFPSMVLDAWRNEFLDSRGTTINNSAAFGFDMSDNRYVFSSQMRFSDMSDANGVTARGRAFEFSHRYRGTEFVLGPLSRGWDIVNSFAYNKSESSAGKPVTNSSYLLTHSWQRSDSRADSRMSVTSNLSYSESSSSQIYSLGSVASLQHRLSHGLTNSFTLSGNYTSQLNRNESGQGSGEQVSVERNERLDSNSAAVSDSVRVDLLRVATFTAGGGARTFTSTTSKSGGLEKNASMSLYLKSRTPILVTGLLYDTEYENGSGSRLANINAVMSGLELFDTWFGSSIGYSSNKVDNVDATGYSDEVVQYMLGFRKGVARGVSVSGTGRIESRSVLKDGTEIRTSRRVGTVNLDMSDKFLISRYVVVSLKYQYTDTPEDRVKGVIDISPTFRRYFKMFSVGADYDYSTVLQGRKAGSSSHAFRLIVSRPFGYIPRRWL